MIVPIKPELLRDGAMKTRPPFPPLQEKPVQALVLSFFGGNRELCNLMRKLSHETRALYIKEKGFQGFLTLNSITEDLRKAEENRELDKLKQEVYIDMVSLLR